MASLSGTRHPVRLAVWLVFVGLLAAASYATRLGGAETPDDVAYEYSSSVAALIQYALMLAVLLLIALGLERRQLFAWRPPPSWPRALGFTAIALLAIWAAAAALAPFLDASEEQGLVPREWDPSRAGPFAAFFVTVTVLAPLVEELTFRGLGLSLLRPYGSRVAVVVTALLFAAAHGLIVGLPVLVVFGIVIGWLRLRTDSIFPPILLHGVFNGTALLVAVATA
ncbi:MAG: type II CAAX endopeptidase family protein [Thermoleophilia bacterium]|nr:CPBP family intramembrane metalloprotease [Gaiellaceae bacterium]MDW8338484.1 type II CAAX endopeptidase family protein [Thermoleophilia bacterium]